MILRIKELFLFLFVIGSLLSLPRHALAANTPTTCPGTPVDFGTTKQFLDAGESHGRPGNCITPTKIVLHITADNLTPQQEFNYFNSGSEGREVSSHFIIGKDGQVLQLVETLQNTVEEAYTVYQYNGDQISLELTAPDIYSGRGAVPPAQYQAALTLVKKLMQQYHIPLGDHDETWKAPSDIYTTTAGPGVYGHYQLNPQTRSDPGEGFMRDFRADLAKDTGTPSPSPSSGEVSTTVSSNCVVTKVGNPTSQPVLPPGCTSQGETTPTTGSTNSNELVKAAEDIRTAYGKCGNPPFKTYTNTGLSGCLQNEIVSLGYSSDQVNAYKQRIISSQIHHNDSGKDCTECLGFVGQALALVTGDPNALLGYGQASSVASDFKAGSSNYHRLPDGSSPQPGDIAVSYTCYHANGNPYTKGCAGHILIIDEIAGVQAKAIEANQDEDCTITDTRDIPLESYSLFRKQ